MRFEIGHRPMFATLNLELDEGDTIVAQPESMISMSMHCSYIWAMCW